MNLTVKAKQLSAALASVGKSVATRPTLPVLSHILLQADQDSQTLVLAGTDLEQFVVRRVICDVQENGSLTVPARLLTDLVKTFQDSETVTLTVSGETLKVQCGKSEADVRGIDANEYPMLPAVMTGGEMVGRFSPDSLAVRLSQVTFAAASDESRPILTGVYVQAVEGVLSFVTADGFRLAWRHDSTELADGTFVMPGKAADILVKLLAEQVANGHTEDVSLWMDANQRAVCWRLYDCDMTTQLLEGTFVNYKQIVPNKWATRLTVDKRELERQLRTVSTFKVQNVHLEMMALDPGAPASGKLSITAQDPEAGKVGGEMWCDMVGDVLTIAFDAKFLSDAVRACATDKIALEFTDAGRPGVVRPVDSDNYLCVIMPMHLRG